MRIAFLSWRDLTHPEGGGAERYAQTVCAGLAARGHDVTLLAAAHPGAPAREVLDGYRILRQGGRAGVYPASVARMRRLERTEGRFDAVVDVQNGLPFLARLATRTPAVVLVHHVHKEQWPVVFGRAMATLGWTLESRVAPLLLRGCQYVAVSEMTRDELVDLGVDPAAVSVIHNGSTPPSRDFPRSAHPRLVVLGRLVPTKRVEVAVDAVQLLRHRFPQLRLRVVGDGWWRERLEQHVRDVHAEDVVDLLGFVDEQTKERELAAAWVALAPSLKEGWGLNVVEAGGHGVPTVAFDGAGGLSESIIDDETGLLAGSQADYVLAIARLLDDDDLRERLGAGARAYSSRFTWTATVDSWERLLTHVAAGGGLLAEVDHELPTPALVPAPGQDRATA